jgi:SAM-dependent methyltransferase
MTTHAAQVPRALEQLEADSVGWDVVNWGRALRFCASRSRLQPGGTALEIGADGDNGGLSLFLAAQGWQVTCSGLEDPSPAKLQLHQRHGVGDLVRYARADVLKLPHEPRYDLVVVKSTLGQVGQGGRFDLQLQAVRNLHQVLRPGGELWVLENGAATWVHQVARRHLGAGRFGWRYLRPFELDVLLAPFASRERASFGVAAAGGRTERQRAVVGRLDRVLLEPLTPSAWRYVLAAVATKGTPA